MSGGTFDYSQHRIDDIAETIELYLARQGKKMPKDETWNDHTHYETFPKEIQEKFKEGIKYLKLAAVYAQRIDWYLAGDDGEENFLKRLEEDLKELTGTMKNKF